MNSPEVVLKHNPSRCVTKRHTTPFPRLPHAPCTPQSGTADAVRHHADHWHLALRSPVRPNPIVSSIVELLAIDGTTLQVRGLDYLNGTPLIDLKPERGAVSD